MRYLVKASFRNCPLNERALFLGSRCLLPISVGQPIHEGEKLASTIALVNRSFHSCVILIDDTVQRYTLAIVDASPMPLLYEKALQLGDEWLARNQETLRTIKIPHTIIRWNQWLHHPEFEHKKKIIVQTQQNNPDFKQAFVKNAEEYLSRLEQRIPLTEMLYPRAFELCFDYLTEECAGMCLWHHEHCEFEVYPSNRNRAMTATYHALIQPEFPHLLRPVGLRFKKYPVREILMEDNP